ncbi:scoloptoxin SSD976 [Papilio machaon]|uniref:scoloptoxin SSD976 n=1 Tax=Papilio machaon TaxID=76193 RepID=UPI001E663D6E|nr:scoloptoxin SSD976 [Papilio machaon]
MRIFIALLFVICCAYCEHIELTCEQIRAFVDGHNNRRLIVAKGLVPGQPAASNMEFMVWDEELAEKASKWAEKNEFKHNPDRTIDSNRWSLVGENIYVYNYYSNMGDEPKIDIENALDNWFQEHKFYNFVPFFLTSINPFGHYTQMVWSNTNRIGCGISQTKTHNHIKTLFVCDYGPTGNYFEQKPYKTNGPIENLLCRDGKCDKPYGPNC